MQTLQDIHLAIPLLVVPAADVSPECLSLMRYLCKEPFDINCKKSEKIISVTKNYKITTPSSIRVHPLFCETFSDLISYIEVLDKEKYNFFLRNYSIVSFIDYSVSKSILNLEDSFNSFPSIPSGQKAFIIYDSPEKIDNFAPSTPTCLCNNQLTEIESYYYILNFLSSIIVECATNLLENGFNSSDLNPKILREVKVRADFAAITHDDQELITQIKAAISNIEVKQHPAFSASFYDLLASFEEIKPGVIAENRLSPSSYNSPFKYINQLQYENSMTPPAIMFYLAAATAYHNAKLYDKCIDASIKIIISTATPSKDNEIGSPLELDADFRLDGKNKGTSKNLLKSIINIDPVSDSSKSMDDGSSTGNGRLTTYSKSLINPLVDYITRCPTASGVLSRAWDLLNCLKTRGMNRKAAVIADQFARVYSKDVSSLFIIFALNNILDDVTPSSIIQGRDLCFPMIINLLEHRQNVPKDIFSRFISKIFCTIGPSLDFQQQELLLHELKRCECAPTEIQTSTALMSTASIESSKLSFLSKSSSTAIPDLYEISKKEELNKKEQKQQNQDQNQNQDQDQNPTDEKNIPIQEENLQIYSFAEDAVDGIEEKEEDQGLKLPIEIVDVIIDKSAVQINKKNPNGNGNSFLFSYLPKKQQEQTTITAAVGSTIIIKYQIRNPFAVTLKLDEARTLIDDESFKNVVSSQFLSSSSTSEVNSYFTPQKSGSFEIKGFEFYFFNMKQLLKLPKTITVQTIDKVPSFNLKTNLPLTSPLHFYYGEAYDFTLWIANTGSVPISQLEVELIQPHMLTFVSDSNFQLGSDFNSNYKLIQFPDEDAESISNTENIGRNWTFLPLAPGAKASINCRMVAKPDETYFSFDIRSYNEESDYFCMQNVRQPFDEIESLKLNRVFLMKNHPQPENDQEFVNLANTIYVGYEVFNTSNSAFQYHMVVNGKESRGIIGAKESNLTIATYNKLELKTDGFDALKERVISLTKVKEEVIGRSLNSQERLAVAQEVSIMQRLEKVWKFNWKAASTRRGILLTEAIQIDRDLIEAIQSNEVVPNISWCLESEYKEDDNKNENEMDNGKLKEIPITEINQFMFYRLVVSFQKNLISMCELDLRCPNPAKSGIIWEENLCKAEKDGKSKYDFKLSFGVCDKFKMFLKHSTVEGKTGFTPIIVSVV